MEKISVIICAYNARQYIRRSIESVGAQSYGDLEMIVVDDGSTDGTGEIAEGLREKYSNLKVLRMDKNRGLFHARIAGVQESKGKYIAFLDADDKISIDWFRLLYEKAEESGADIVCGQMTMERAGAEFFYENLDPLRQDFELCGKAAADAFFRQHGSYFTWWTIWNKLYSRGLWEEAMLDLKRFDAENPKFFMCEDHVFSTALWLRASKACGTVRGARYFYYKGGEGRRQKTKAKFEKNLSDIAKSFAFMQSQAEKFGLYEAYRDDLQKWKSIYAQIYYRDYAELGKRYCAKTIGRILGVEASESAKGWDFFYSISTQTRKSLFSESEKIRKKICDPAIRVVSFDIFDTLVLRPLYRPTDLFCFLNDEFNRICESDTYIDFSQMRVEAEKRCREKMNETHSGEEDITLDAVYDVLVTEYGVRPQAAEAMKEAELLLELKFCTPRRAAKQLFELALSQGKKVIVCSDMYLPERTVKEILKKCGYEYSALYLSSSCKVGKYTGSLYKYVSKELRMPASEFFHIGDNPESDVKQAKLAGWNAAWFPRCVDRFENAIPEMYGGDSLRRMVRCGRDRDMRAAGAYLGYRCAMALAANRLFDDPFADINEKTDFNADPYRVGYYALGQYLYAVTDWVIENAKEKNARALHFAARDGYLPLKALCLFAAAGEKVPRADYVYLSRKAMAISDIAKPQDLQSLVLKFTIANQSAKTLVNLFKPVLREEAGAYGEKEMAAFLGYAPSVYRKKFLCREEYDTALRRVGDLIDYQKLQEYRERLRKYFGGIFGRGDLLFDIGYSGRCESSLTKMLGFPVDSLYIHTNSDMAEYRSREAGFCIRTFYGHKPTITGVVREHVFMKLAPSVIGYRFEDGDVKPVFEEYSEEYSAAFVTDTMQKAALDFVKDMLDTFGDMRHMLSYRREDLAFAFEYYLHFSKRTDRKIFAGVLFEDGFGLGKSFNIFENWEAELRNNGLLQAEDLLPQKYRSGIGWRIANKLLPFGSRRREFVKKVYHKLF